MKGVKSAFLKIIEDQIAKGPKVKWIEGTVDGEPRKVPVAKYVMSSAEMRVEFIEMGFNPKRRSMREYLEAWTEAEWIVKTKENGDVMYIITDRGLGQLPGIDPESCKREAEEKAERESLKLTLGDDWGTWILEGSE